MAHCQFATFYLGDDLFGIDILLVREIIRNLEITPVNRIPDYIRGVLNLRGQIVTVLDLAVRLGLEKREIGKNSVCIILKTVSEIEHRNSGHSLNDSTSTDLVGLVADRIGDVVSIDSAEIEPPPPHAHGVKGQYLSGVIKLENRLLVTLKTSQILAMDTAAEKKALPQTS